MPTWDTTRLHEQVTGYLEDDIRGRNRGAGDRYNLVSVREAIAHKHTRVVGGMVKDLAKEDGITGGIREDREVLLVATATWDTTRLHEWVTRYLKEKIPD